MRTAERDASPQCNRTIDAIPRCDLKMRFYSAFRNTQCNPTPHDAILRRSSHDGVRTMEQDGMRRTESAEWSRIECAGWNPHNASCTMRSHDAARYDPTMRSHSAVLQCDPHNAIPIRKMRCDLTMQSAQCDPTSHSARFDPTRQSARCNPIRQFARCDPTRQSAQFDPTQ